MNIESKLSALGSPDPEHQHVCRDEMHFNDNRDCMCPILGEDSIERWVSHVWARLQLDLG